MANYKRIPISERLESKIMPIPHCGCWWWTGGLDPNGYGLIDFWNQKPKQKLAHRVVYEFYCGPIADDLELDHLCRTPSCVNPDHLEPVTHAVNMARGIHATKTHCKNGHPLSGSNLLRRADRPMARECLACRKDRLQKFYLKNPNYNTRSEKRARAET